MKEDTLRTVWESELDADPDAVNQVVTAAMKLQEDGQYERDTDPELTAEIIVNQIDTANGHIRYGWNWWMEELTAFYEGEYDTFRIDIDNEP